MYTECPNCQTVFNITPEQLKLAAGKVRCGRCDHVFNALNSLSEELPPGAVVETSGDDLVAGALDEMDVLASEPAAAAGLSDIEDMSLEGGEEQLDNLQLDDFDQAPEAADATVGEVSEVADFSPDLEADLSDDFDMEEIPEPVSEAGAIDLDGAGELSDMAPEPVVEDSAEEVFDLGSMDSVEESPAAEETPLSGFELGEDKPLAEAATDVLHEGGRTVTEFDMQDKAESQDYILEELGESDKGEKTGGKRTFSTILWSLVIIVLLAVLAGQFVYFKRADLVKYPAAVPAVEMVCKLISQFRECEVPAPRDLKAISMTERHVGTHPDTQGALLITAVIISDAEFDQPFPKLELSFSDMQEKILARRTFEPQQYLGPDVDIQAGMKKGVPVRVVLEIVDPGEEAVNFEFNFR